MTAPTGSGPADWLKRAKEALGAEDARVALGELRRGATPADPFPLQAQYARMALTLAPRLGDLPTLRLGVLAGSTVAQWVDSLRFWLLLEGFRLESYVGLFDAWRQEALDASSALFKFAPDFVWFFLTARDLRLPRQGGTSEADVTSAIADAVQDVAACVHGLTSRTRAAVIVNNAEPSLERTLGNYEGAVSWAHAALVRRYNLELPPALPPGAIVFDLEHQAASVGLERWEDPRLWAHSKHPFAFDAIGPVAFAGARLLAASRGRAKKCVVVDLDNTLWGGIVGDDGVEGIRIGPGGGAAGEAFQSFQRYLKSLADRGIALAVCSKNEEATAKEAFRSRQEMVLRLEDLSAFRANWNDKVTNLREIAAELNLGLDSFVFVDDNPAERALVKSVLPEVAVPEMPADPAEYVRTVAAGRWFETVAFSDEDRRRTQTYRENTGRRLAQSASVDLDAYLRDLEMRAEWGPVDATRTPRVAQLVNKTNQFHPTTTRYSEAELARLASDPGAWVGWFSLRDRFGDHGLIAVVILRFDGDRATIDTWAMSCRVFSRGMEDFTFARACAVARAKGARVLEGRYVPTVKNGVVADLYKRLGGAQHEAIERETKWRFELGDTAVGDHVHIVDATGEHPESK